MMHLFKPRQPFLMVNALLIVMAVVVLAGCKSNGKKPTSLLASKPDLLGEYESIGEKSTAMLEVEEPRSNRGVIDSSPEKFYQHQLTVQDAGEYELLTYRARNLDAEALKTALDDQLVGGIVDRVTAIPDTNQVMIRIKKDAPTEPRATPATAAPDPGDADENESTDVLADAEPGEADKLPAPVEADESEVEAPRSALSPAEVRQRLVSILAAIDQSPPQIMIEVDIVRIFSDYTYDVRAILDAVTRAGDTLSPSLNVDMPGAHLRSPMRSRIAGQYGIIAEFGKTTLEAALDALESQGFAEGLARPSLLVSHGKMARVELLKKIPIPKDLVIQNNIVRTTEFEDVPSFLEIVPQVRDAGLIHLNVKSGFGSLEPSGPVQIPIINNRQTQIEGVHLKQGQTLVIASFLDEETVAVERKVPILGDIPLIGILFTGVDKEKRKDMILFMVTPYYVNVSQDVTEREDGPADSGPPD